MCRHWSVEGKLLHHTPSSFIAKSIEIKRTDSKHCSYAQYSPFKSTEFEIFAKNRSFLVLMFKSHKFTIMQIWFAHDPRIDQATFHNPKQELCCSEIWGAASAATFLELAAEHFLSCLQAAKLPIILSTHSILDIKHPHYCKKNFIFVLISVQDCRKKWLPFYIHACQLISLISSAHKCIERGVCDQGGQCKLLTWHVNICHSPLVFDHFRIARTRIFVSSLRYKYWQLTPHSVPTREHI